LMCVRVFLCCVALYK